MRLPFRSRTPTRGRLFVFLTSILCENRTERASVSFIGRGDEVLFAEGIVFTIIKLDGFLAHRDQRVEFVKLRRQKLFIGHVRPMLRVQRGGEGPAEGVFDNFALLGGAKKHADGRFFMRRRDDRGRALRDRSSVFPDAPARIARLRVHGKTLTSGESF